MNKSSLNMKDPEDVKQLFVKIKLLCAQGKLDKATSLYRSLQQQMPKSEITKEVRSIVADSLRMTFADVLSDEEGVSLFKPYVINAPKKINIMKDIDIFSIQASKTLAEGNTLLFYDRLFSIFNVLKNLHKIEGAVFELGVFRGGTLKFMAELCRQFGQQRAIVGFDTFTGHPHTVEADGIAHFAGAFGMTSFEGVSEYVASHKEIRLVQGDVMQTLDAELEAVCQLAFVHLDVDLYTATAYSLPKLEKALAPGGFILVDDYGFVTCAGLKQAVDDFLKTSALRAIHLLTGQCLLIK